MLKSNLAPIGLFTYNRLDETIKTVEALKRNHLAKDSDLIIYSDAPKSNFGKEKVWAVREYLESIEGFKSIKLFKADENKGLANSIIDGVSDVITEYGKVIVLEDDLITLPNFLDFMNQCLDFYENIDSIQTINGFSPLINCVNPVYFHTRSFPWGWATWKKYWDKDIFDKDVISNIINEDETILNNFKKKCGQDISSMLLDSINGKNDSWYVRWVFSHFMSNKYSVYPKMSLIENIGFSDEATNCKGIKTYKYEMDNDGKRAFEFNDSISVNNAESKQFLNYFSKIYRLKIRIPLLFSISGLKLLLADIKSKV